MIGSSLMTGLGISGVSTGLYAAFTSENEENKYIDRKNEYLCIFCIIFAVAFILIYITITTTINLLKLITIATTITFEGWFNNLFISLA